MILLTIMDFAILLCIFYNRRFGGKIMISTCMGLSIISSVISPAAARISPYALMAVRIFLGLAQVDHIYIML